MLIDLSNEFCLIEVEGSDALTFLQGQLSNNIKLLNDNNYQFNAYLNPKGRMLAFFMVFQIKENHYLLLTTREISEAIIKRLKMFVLRSKVSVSLSSQIALFSDKPLDGYKNVAIPNDCYVCIGATHSNAQTSLDQWHHYLIEQKISFIYLSTQELFVPQHLSLDKINALSFDKGCYVGQEIVARMHYLGKSKRHLINFMSEHPSHRGDPIYSPQFNNQEVGNIVDIIKWNNHHIGLASIQAECKDIAYLDLDDHLSILFKE